MTLKELKSGKVKIEIPELELAWDELTELIEYLKENPANAPIYVVIGTQKFEAV